MRRLVVSSALAALVGACSSTQKIPTEQFVETRATVRAAEEVGGEKVPSAQVHLDLARNSLALAQRLNDDGEVKKAELELMRAHADAELALALAREVPLRMEAQRLMQQAQRLQGDGSGGSGFMEPGEAQPEDMDPHEHDPEYEVGPDDPAR